MNSQVTDSRKLVNRSHWQAWTIVLIVSMSLTGLAAMRIYLPCETSIAMTIQEAHQIPGLEYLSTGFYRFGLAPFYPLAALTAAGLATRRGNLLAAAFIGPAAASRPLGTVIKELVERPRPTEGLVTYVEHASGFSYPSGHVFGTVLLVGFIAYLLVRAQQSSRGRLLVAAAAGIFMLIMGLLRVYAGAHWPTDVIAAYLWGGLVLFVLIQAYRAVSHLLESRSRNAVASRLIR